MKTAGQPLTQRQPDLNTHLYGAGDCLLQRRLHRLAQELGDEDGGLGGRLQQLDLPGEAGGKAGLGSRQAGQAG